jgi:hypothetical protein
MATLMDLSSSTKNQPGDRTDRSYGASNGVSADPTSSGDPGSSRDQEQMQIAVQDTFRRNLASWAVDDFVLNGTVCVDDPEAPATVVVEDSSKEVGDRFQHVSAAVVPYYPSRIKVDTGSTDNFVTLEYLKKAGFNIKNLRPIPDSEQVEVEGLNQVMYKPKFRVNLKYYRQGEAIMNDKSFLVIDNGPFDLLLSSHHFVAEAERRLFALPLVRPRNKKTRGKANQSLPVPEAYDMSAC